MKELLNRIEEASYEPPAGFETKKAKITVKRIQKSYNGVEFLIDGLKVYDDYMKDYIGSVQPEFMSDPLLKAKYSDKQIDAIRDKMWNVRDGIA